MNINLIQRINNNLDKIFLFCLAGLIIVLPIAHTSSLRSIFIVLTIALTCYKLIKQKTLPAPTQMELPLFLYFITIIISLFTSLKLSSSLSALRGEFIIPIAIFYAVFTNIKDEDKLGKLYWVICLASLVMCLIGIREFIVKNGVLTNYDVRVGSLHQGYEAFAQYLIIIIPYTALGALNFKDSRQKIFLAVLLLIQIFTLYITFTLGSWAGLVMEVILLMLLVAKTTAKRLILSAGCIVLFLTAGALMPKRLLFHGNTGGIYLDEEHLEKNTTSNRLIKWKASAEQLIKDPFKGAGYGKANFRRRFADRPKIASFEQAHNSFVNIAIQLGIQGLLALLFILYTLLKLTWNGYKNATTPFEKILLGGTWIMIWGFFTGNMGAEFFIDDTALLFWILCALSLAQREKLKI